METETTSTPALVWEIDAGDPFGDAIDFNFNALGDRLYSDENTRVKDLQVRPLQRVLGGSMVEVMVLESRTIRYQETLATGRKVYVTKEFHQQQFLVVDPHRLSVATDEVRNRREKPKDNL